MSSAQIALPSQAGQKCHIGQVPEHAIGLLLKKHLPTEQFTLLIAQSQQQAQHLTSLCRDVFGADNVYLFPDWETLPYDYFSPHQDLISERLQLLARLPSLSSGIVVCAATTLMQHIAPVNYIAGQVFQVKLHDRWDMTVKRRCFERAGYYCVDQVMQRGEFAVRGSIIDIFPMGSNRPYRIDLFDNTVDSIRSFDVETQRSSSEVKHITCLPAHEFPLTQEACQHFLQQWRNHFADRSDDSSVKYAIDQGRTTGGMEYYLPLFFEETALLTDYLPENSVIIHCNNTAASFQKHWQYIDARYQDRHVDLNQPCLSPELIYTRPEELQQTLKGFAQVYLQPEASKHHNWSYQPLPTISINAKAATPYQTLKNFLTDSTLPLIFSAESNGRREVLAEHLEKIALKPKRIDHWQANLPKVSIWVSHIQNGGIYPDIPAVIITENDLFPHKVPQQRQAQKTDGNFNQGATIRDLTELNVGDAVVHIEHGVARYLGLTHLDLNGQTNEYLTLEYAGEDKLYVPVRSIHLISRYSSADLDNPPINQLGTDRWAKAKEKAAKRIHDVAAELLAVQAKRTNKPGLQHPYTAKDYETFAEQFPFSETPDQQQAIDAVVADMTSDRPMDRLLCGDVGFGKTEVAMRAAFVAVHGGRQAAILVPTTLLAQQHYDNFCDRFADWPVKIALLSRFQTGKQTTATLEALKKGQVDIIIGTHKLLSKDIQFKQLGLVIVDEEHRFGVRHKERLKTLRAEVDMLTMTATPIPRTLNLSLSSLRDLSIIATPPAKRLSVMTFVKPQRDALVKEAFLREVLRGGQVYYLHNNVETIHSRLEQLQQLLPDVKMAFAHGQMRERELERLMADFYHNRFQVLICTTIIETGIDIPNANTIIIERADRFGLAQLHQLRGRVGRSHHQAYAYLMTPPLESLTKDAQKRLAAIEHASDLGAGFQLANHDLEIRGSGEILGDEQSGNMQSIGYDLYMEFLDKAVNALKSGRTLDIETINKQQCEIDLRISNLLPDDYLGDPHIRLQFYQRIASAKTQEDLNNIRIALIDRFGTLPEPAQHLFDCAHIRLSAETLGIAKIEAHSQGGKITFTDTPAIEPMTLIRLIQSQPKQYQLQGETALKFKTDCKTPAARIEAVNALLSRLDQKEKR